MKYYVSCTLADATTGYLIYEGMSQADIEACLATVGASVIEYLDSTTWQTNMLAQKAQNH